MAKRRKIKQQEVHDVEKQAERLKNSVGYDVKYENVRGFTGSRADLRDDFDRIINKWGSYSLIEEMDNNDAFVGAFSNLMESFVNAEEFNVKASDDSEDALYYKEFLEQCLEDMEISLAKTMKSFLTYPKYGFQISEMLFKKRLGHNPDNPKKNSKYEDGLIGIRKISPRHQRTIDDFIYDNWGRISAVKQNDPDSYSQSVEIPYSRILHFVFKPYNNNPWGKSAYRNAAQSYYMKKKLRLIQLINAERGLSGGIPKGYYPIQWADSNHPSHSVVGKMKTDLEHLTSGEDASVLLPNIIDPSSGKRLLDIEIENTGNTQSEEIEKMLDRCDNEIVISLLSDLFISGKAASISGSLGNLKISIFTEFIATILNTIKDELNKKLIPMLWELNGFPKEYMPEIVHTNLSKLNLVNLSLLVQSAGKTGLLPPTRNLVNSLIEVYGGGAIDPMTQEEWDLAQQRKDVQYVDNLDIETIDDYDSLANSKNEENKGENWWDINMKMEKNLEVLQQQK